MWVFIGDEQLWRERLPATDSPSSHWTLFSGEGPLPNASVYLDLNGVFARHRPETTPPDAWWMMHAPEYTLSEHPPQTIRINGWPGFTEGSDWEVVAPNPEAENICSTVLNSLGKRPVFAPDQVGSIGARVLVSIINEAYLLMGEGSASRQDIDQALKLGTNYPMGPFEWSERIGLPAVYSMLKRLSETETRYTPAPAMAEANLSR